MLTRLILSFALLAIGLVLPSAFGLASALGAQAVNEQEPQPSIADYRAMGLKALERQDKLAASDAADRMLEAYGSDPRAMRSAADLYLRSGKINSSIKQFERYLAEVPGDKPELWQYGIALALVERYDEARKLFELHRIVNPNDVENAAWHFLCVAKKSGLREAKKLVLPAPGDVRIPMEEIRRMLIDGDENRVAQAVEQLGQDSPRRDEANFYSKLYIALYADASGKADRAIKLLEEATQIDQANYMGDVAKVYLNELQARLANPGRN